MKNQMKSKLITAVISAFLMVFSVNCSTGTGGKSTAAATGPCIDQPSSRAVTNSAATDVSHRAGEACLGCHNGSKALTFTVAGTMYTSASSSTVATTTSVSYVTGGAIPVDTCGNFYSTATHSGTVTSSTGAVMTAPITGGNSDCNSCHTGATTTAMGNNTRIY
ncbi:MAG: hypothetical protein OEV78_08395 [Spirochaetia bacterium]|nr:hypothetical protein [Spirochaetia bacterium]